MSSSSIGHGYRAIAPAPDGREAALQCHQKSRSQGSLSLHVNNQQFQTIGEAINHIESMPQEHRHAAELHIFNQLLQGRDRHEDAIAELVEYVAQNKDWRYVGLSDAFANDQWQIGTDIRNQVHRRRNEMRDVYNMAVTLWGDERVAIIWRFITTDWMAKQLRKVVNLSLPFESFVLRANHAIYNRIANPGRGIRNTPILMTADIDKALNGPDPPPLQEDQLRKLHLCIGEDGFIAPIAASASLIAHSNAPRSVAIAHTPTPPPDHHLRRAPSIQSIDMDRAAETPSELPQGALPQTWSDLESLLVDWLEFHLPRLVKSSAQSEDQENLPSTAPETANSDKPDGHQAITNARGVVRRNAAAHALDLIHNLREDLAGSCADGDDDDGDDDNGDVSGEDDEEPSEPTSRANSPATSRRPLCRKLKSFSCGCLGVPDGLIADLRPGSKNKQLAALAVLRRYGRIQDDDGHAGAHMCYSHVKKLATKLGLKTRETGKVLEQRLRMIYNSADRFDEVTTHRDSYKWFRRDRRPPRPEDALGIYRFAATPILPRVATSFDKLSSDNLCALAGIADSTQLLGAWKRDGSVVLSGIFSWLREPELVHMIKEEFDMYYHHQREISGKPNYGWLRNMYHSFIQQLIRRDPVYCMMYTFLREDHPWRLISYPYYAKYAKPGDSTAFRHIDINIPKCLASDRGRCMIQGSVSFDEEKEGDCTELLLGMHGNLAEWWERVKVRGHASDGYVHCITPQMWTAEDALHFNTDWTDQPCGPLDARISDPRLPHGAHGPTTRIRRTLLPWFVKIRDDHTHLEVLEAGTWAELSSAHRDLVPGPSSPSSLTNRYATVPHSFPAAMQLPSLGPVSDALVGRKRWDEPDVIQEIDFLWTGPVEDVVRHINNYRSQAVRVWKQYFGMMVSAEKAAYGARSYFYCKENGIASNALVDEAPSEAPSEDEDGGRDCDETADHY